MDIRPDLKRKTALITGASVGIGHELARVFGRASYDLILVARNRDKLEEVATEISNTYKVRCIIVTKDLTAATAPQEIFDELRKADLDVHVLVNNAGFGTNGMFYQADVDTQTSMIDLNCRALVHMTRLFLAPMVEARAGKVLNIASTAAFQPGPKMAVYYASKAFVVSFSEAIAHETRDCGVTVTAFCPGPTHTEFQKRAGIEQSNLFGGGAMDARRVAVEAYQALMDGKRVGIPGVKNKMLAAGAYYMPNRIVNRVVNHLNSDREAK